MPIFSSSTYRSTSYLLNRMLPSHAASMLSSRLSVGEPSASFEVDVEHALTHKRAAMSKSATKTDAITVSLLEGFWRAMALDAADDVFDEGLFASTWTVLPRFRW